MIPMTIARCIISFILIHFLCVWDFFFRTPDKLISLSPECVDGCGEKVFLWLTRKQRDASMAAERQENPTQKIGSDQKNVKCVDSNDCRTIGYSTRHLLLAICRLHKKPRSSDCRRQFESGAQAREKTVGSEKIKLLICMKSTLLLFGYIRYLDLVGVLFVLHFPLFVSATHRRIQTVADRDGERERARENMIQHCIIYLKEHSK